MRYRRANTAGATYFITANLAERHTSPLTDHIDFLREAFRWLKARHTFEIDALVVLPDHFHLMMTLPTDDAKFSLRIGAIQSAFSSGLPKTEYIRSSRDAKRESGIRQRCFWEHLIRDDRDYANHIDHIHINPVKRASSNTRWIGHTQRSIDMSSVGSSQQTGQRKLRRLREANIVRVDVGQKNLPNVRA